MSRDQHWQPWPELLLYFVVIAWEQLFDFFFFIYTVVQVAGEGGMGEDEVVEVGVLLECWKISSSRCECPGGEVATRLWAVGSRDAKFNEGECVIALTTLNSTHKLYLMLVVPTSQYWH